MRLDAATCNHDNPRREPHGKSPAHTINLQLSVEPTLVTLQWLYENLGCNEDRRQPW